MLFWNTGEPRVIGGLDILGVRAVDQAIEVEWVGGVTTVTQRARYLSVLPWVIDEFYRAHADQGEFSRAELDAAISRADCVVFLSTRIAADQGEADLGRGTVGGNKFRDVGLRGDFDENDEVDLLAEAVTNSPAIYFALARSSGLLDDAANGLPYRIQAGGVRAADTRRAVAAGSELRDAIIHGGLVTRTMLEESYPLFALNGLRRDEFRAEREVIVEHLLGFSESVLDPSLKERFRQTVAWVLREAQTPTDAPMLLKTVLGRAVEEKNLTKVERAFAEYELRRHAHRELERMLDAFWRSLNEIGRGAVVDVVGGWIQREAALGERLDSAPIPAGNDDEHQAMAAAVNLASLLTAFDALVAHDHIKAHEQGTLEHAFTLVRELLDAPLGDVLQALVDRVIVPTHLQNTYRKMSQGQECSLRFYRDGDTLRPLENEAGFGMSGDRLSDVFQFLFDLSFMDLEDVEGRSGERFVTNANGRELLTKLEAR